MAFQRSFLCSTWHLCFIGSISLASTTFFFLLFIWDNLVFFFASGFYLSFIVLECSWPLNYMGLHCKDPLIHACFSANTILFWSMVGILWIWRANCVHWSMPFNTGDLNIRGFWFPVGPWNQSPTETKGQPV